MHKNYFRYLFEPAGDTPPGQGNPPVVPPVVTPPVVTPPAGDKPRLGYIKDDLTFEDGWQNQLPDTFKDYRATLANYKSFDALTKALIDSKTAAMAKAGLKVPGADAKPEEIAAFRKELGVPDTEDGYGFKAPDKAELKQYYNEDGVKLFAKQAKELGLTPAQAQSLVNSHVEAAYKADQIAEEAGKKFFADQDKALRDLWANKYDENMLDAKRVAITFGMKPDELKLVPNEIVIGLAKLAQGIGEGKLVGREAVTNNLTGVSQARDIQQNKQNPDYEAYWTPTHPNHKAVVAKVLKLNE